VVVAIAITLAALWAHFTQLGNLAVARFIRVRATIFVVLMTIAYTVAEQIFKTRSTSTLLMASLLTGAFGIAALLTAASAFKRAAAPAVGTNLPTATLVNPD
jgi:Co/Zn/Cd efflux system component